MLYKAEIATEIASIVDVKITWDEGEWSNSREGYIPVGDDWDVQRIVIAGNVPDEEIISEISQEYEDSYDEVSRTNYRFEIEKRETKKISELDASDLDSIKYRLINEANRIKIEAERALEEMMKNFEKQIRRLKVGHPDPLKASLSVDVNIETSGFPERAPEIVKVVDLDLDA